MALLLLLFSLISKFLICLIHGYQYIISPLFGPHCKFQLTCSQYGVEAIRSFGALKGSWLTLKRILKCHPFHSSGENSTLEKNQHKREY